MTESSPDPGRNPFYETASTTRESAASFKAGCRTPATMREPRRAGHPLLPPGCSRPFREPFFETGVFSEVLVRGWRNELGRTIWEFTGAGGQRFLVIAHGRLGLKAPLSSSLTTCAVTRSRT
jgi:hypothetical protein